VTLADEVLAQPGAEEAGGAGDQDVHAVHPVTGPVAAHPVLQ
jgi:hypothetical protein